MTPATNAQGFRGRALLDGVAALLPVPAESVALLLPAFPDVTLPKPDRKGDVAVLVECWRIRDGQPEAAGIVEHTLSESAGAASAALLSGVTGALLAAAPAGLVAAGAGAALGFRGGPLATLVLAPLFAGGGALAGSALAGSRAAARGAPIGGLAARAWSERLGRTFGTYHEVLLALPGASLAGRPYALVIGMLTDSFFARAVDQGLAYGFRKRRATFVSRDDSVSAYAPDQRMLLSMRAQRPSRGGEATAAWEALEQSHALPLLGYVGAGNYAVSRLARYPHQGAARSEPRQISLEFGEDGLALLSGRSFTVPACTAGVKYGALGFSNVLTRISAPERAPTVADLGPKELP